MIYALFYVMLFYVMVALGAFIAIRVDYDKKVGIFGAIVLGLFWPLLAGFRLGEK